MLQGIAVFAQTRIQLDLHKPGTETARLKIESSAAAEAVLITVKNAEGITLFTDKAKTDQYVKLIDFKKLSQGMYFVDMQQAKGITRKVLVKNEQGLSIQEGNYYFNNLISFKEEDKKLFVRFNNNIKQPVTIRIMDSRGNVVHEENGITAETYASKFNLAGLSHGHYKVSLTSGAYSSYRNISL